MKNCNYLTRNLPSIICFLSAAYIIVAKGPEIFGWGWLLLIGLLIHR